MNPAEKELLKKAQAGDRESLGRLLMMHEQGCYSFALRLTGSAADAQDVCQEAFSRVVRDVASWQPTGDFRHWLLRIIVCAHRDRLSSESARRRRERSYAMVRESAVGGEPSVDQEELRRNLATALEQLEEDCRLPIVLHYEQGLSHSQAAAVLAMPEGTVKSNIYKGLEDLRRSMSRVGYGTLAIPALVAALSSLPTVAAPAALTAFTKSLAAGGAAKTAAVVSTKLAAQKAIGLALGWKIAIAVSAVALGGVAMSVVAARLPAASAPSQVSDAPALPDDSDAAEPAAEPVAGRMLLEYSFEDGQGSAEWTGKVVPGPARKQNRFCIAGETAEGERLTRVQVMDDAKGIYVHRAGATLSFDYWVDDTVITLDMHVWDRTRQVSAGNDAIWQVARKRWTRVSLRIDDFRANGEPIRPGDLLTEITIQTGQPGRLYIDNICVTIPEPESEVF